MQLDPQLLEILACPDVPRAAARGRRRRQRRWSARRAAAGWPIRSATTSRSCCSTRRAARHCPTRRTSAADGGRARRRRSSTTLAALDAADRGRDAAGRRVGRGPGPRGAAALDGRGRRAPRSPTDGRPRAVVVAGMGGVGHRGRRARGRRRPAAARSRCVALARLPAARLGRRRWTWCIAVSCSGGDRGDARRRRRGGCAAARGVVAVGAAGSAAGRAHEARPRPRRARSTSPRRPACRGRTSGRSPVPLLAGRSTRSGWPSVPGATCWTGVADQLDARAPSAAGRRSETFDNPAKTLALRAGRLAADRVGRQRRWPTVAAARGSPPARRERQASRPSPAR